LCANDGTSVFDSEAATKYALDSCPQWSKRVMSEPTAAGIGISAQDLERLARPFEQVESQHSKTTQGTGLGLALTKSLVEMHGGLLDLKSAPGQGTVASFALPVRQSAPVALPGAAAA